MLDPTDESKLKELDVDMLAKDVVTLEQIIKDLKVGEVSKTIFVTPPAMNARPARVQRFYRILFSMITQKGGHALTVGTDLPIVTSIPHNPSFISRPSAWNILAELSHCLSAVAEDHCIELTQSDKLGQYWQVMYSLKSLKLHASEA